MTSTENPSTDLLTPQTPVLSVSCKILRSPSHESVTTDLSLFSVSSIASDLYGRKHLCISKDGKRGPSPNPDSRGNASNRPENIPEILWFEEENEIIRNCAVLSSAAGLQKSFSTSDISQLPSPDETSLAPGFRNALSELALNSLQRCSFFMDNFKLDHTSRSCSTWVAVGDVASTSQLPSPHGGHSTTTISLSNTPPPPAFTAADFIRSVNKKVRQNYIRRRLLTTYKALERLCQSEFNLDRLQVSLSSTAANNPPNTTFLHPNSGGSFRLTVPGNSTPKSPVNGPSGTSTGSSNSEILRAVKQSVNKNNLPLTIRDVERERGKPLSKYERNMMIFNWLHTLDDSAFAEGVQ